MNILEEEVVLIFIFLLAIIGMAVCCVISFKTKPSDCGGGSVHSLFSFLAGFSGVVAFIMFIAICCLSLKLATSRGIDDKIEMYQAESAKIEAQIDRIVKDYLEYEKETRVNFKTEDSPMTLMALCPELKSDALVQQQLDVYIQNNAQIRELRKQQIDIAQIKWLLYFGS